MKKLIEKITKNTEKNKESQPKHGLYVLDHIGACTDNTRLLLVDTPLDDGWHENGSTKKDCPGKFIDYSRVIPKDTPTVSFILPADKMLGAIKCASVCARYSEPKPVYKKCGGIKPNNALHIEITGTHLVLSSKFLDDAGYENNITYTEDITPTWHEENTGTYSFLADCNTLIDFLKAAKKEYVILECFRPSYPFVLTIPGAKYICMPMAY